MNERIKELYNQSLEEKYQYGGSDAKPGEMYSNYITVLNPEKFAELIVEECINVCKSRVGNSDYNTGRLHCVSDIRERFGLNGMSTEDKKTLIKELLGVKE
jgi:uncharacterized membrane protein